MPDASNIPVPDPSVVTGQRIDSEIKNLRELLEERLDGMDKAIKLVNESAAKIPTAAQIDIANLREIIAEKFNNINNRFNDREKTTKDAILKAEAVVTKTEAFLVKQIDQLFTLSQLTANRVQVLESSKAGATETKTDSLSSRTLLITAIGVATAIIVAVLTLNHATPSAAPNYTVPVPMSPVAPAK